MDHHEVQHLLARAAEDGPAPVDVTGAVLRAVRRGPPFPARGWRGFWLRRGVDPSLVAAAGVSLAAAVLVGWLALPWLETSLDPMWSLVPESQLALPEPGEILR